MLQVEGKTAVTTKRGRDQPRLSGEEQVSALHAHDAGGMTCPGAKAVNPGVLEYDPRFQVRAAGFTREILSHLFTADSCSFEAFDAKVPMHERRTTKVMDDDVRPQEHGGRVIQ